MGEIRLEIDEGTPQYSCSTCRSCSSIFGKSLCSVKDRGCCWYFPKFTLHDIHKMTKSDEGLKVLDRIATLPAAKIYSYYIHAKGYFDEAGYKKYILSRHANQYELKDKTILFRGCPFINPGEGCTIPVKHRTHVCNFFICDEIVEEAGRYEEFKPYLRERERYAKWVEWENKSLEFMFREMGLNLLHNFSEIIRILKDIPLTSFEFQELRPVEIEDEYSVGA